VVGVGTVVADDCRLTVRAVTGTNPVRVVLDPQARAPYEAHVFQDPTAPTIWMVADDRPVPASPAAHVEVVPVERRAEDGGFATSDVLDALAARGLGRVLVEGGGVTVSRFLADGSLDRLFVTTAALLVGDGVPGLRFDGSDRLADAMRAPSRHFALGDDMCVELDLAAARTTPAARLRVADDPVSDEPVTSGHA
jgi:riboflavin biosynthesis pyrimidine reductase